MALVQTNRSNKNEKQYSDQISETSNPSWRSVTQTMHLTNLQRETNTLNKSKRTRMQSRAAYAPVY